MPCKIVKKLTPEVSKFITEKSARYYENYYLFNLKLEKTA